MQQHGRVARPIDWIGSFPFLRMLRELRSAANITRVLLGFAAFVSLYVGGRALDALWGASGAISGTLADQIAVSHFDGPAARAHMLMSAESPAAQGHYGPFRAFMHYEIACAGSAGRALLSGRIGYSATSEPGLLDSLGAAGEGIGWIVANRPLFAVIYGFLHAIVFGLFGVAICRHAAIQSARGISLGFWEVLGYARERWRKSILLGIAPPAALGAIAVVLMLGWLVLSWIAHLPTDGITPIVLLVVAALVAILASAKREAVGIFHTPLLAGALIVAMSILVGYFTGYSLLGFLGFVLAGAGYCVALLGGAFMALLLIAIVAALPLARAAMAAKGSETLDAAQTGASYVIQRPWKFAFHALLLCIYAILALVAARGALLLTLKLTHTATAAGFSAFGAWSGEKSAQPALDAIWHMPAWTQLSLLPTGGGLPWWGQFGEAMTSGEAAMAWFVGLWVFLLVGALGGYAISLFYTGATQIYFLHRREVDGDDYEDVHIADAEEDYGFEPLAEDVARVPVSSVETPAGRSLPVIK